MHHLSVCLLAMACLAGAASGSGDHSHGDEGQPEYLALYSLGVGGSHTLEFTGAGEETSIEFMVVPSSSADHEGLGEAEEASALGESRSVYPLNCGWQRAGASSPSSPTRQYFTPVHVFCCSRTSLYRQTNEDTDRQAWLFLPLMASVTGPRSRNRKHKNYRFCGHTSQQHASSSRRVARGEIN